MIAAESRTRDDLRPAALGIDQLAGTWVALLATRLHQARLREVAGEVARVDGDRRDRAGSPKANQRPVVSGLAPAASLPSVDQFAPISKLTGVVDWRIRLE